MENASIFVIMVSAILVNNFVLSRFLGICPFLGVSKQVELAFGMGMVCNVRYHFSRYDHILCSLLYFS